MSEANSISSMTSDEEKCMEIYDNIVNNVEACNPGLENLVPELRRFDHTGQFLASTARFLAAVDKEGYSEYIPLLIEAAIERDRERRYIGQLLEAIWGKEYKDNAEAIAASDDTFRRLYKRVYPSGTFN